MSGGKWWRRIGVREPGNEAWIGWISVTGTVIAAEKGERRVVSLRKT